MNDTTLPRATSRRSRGWHVAACLIATWSIFGSFCFSSVQAQDPLIKPPKLTRPPQQEARESQERPQKGLVVSGQLRQLGTIAEQMRTVAERLAADELGDQTLRLQEEILQEVDRLLSQTDPASPPGGAPRSPSQAEGDEQSPTPPREDAETTPGEEPGDGTSGSGSGRSATEGPQDRAAWAESAWGHLPDRVQTELRAVLQQQYLPKYEKLIEAYYKRLASGDQDRP